MKAAVFVALTGKQKRTLRALGHHLKVVLQVGKTGVTKGVIAAASQALKDHELIKVKIDAEKEARGEALEALVKETGAAVAQTMGKTALLFKQRKNKPKIKLEAPAKAPAAKRKSDGDAEDPRAPAAEDEDEDEDEDEGAEADEAEDDHEG